MFYLKDQSIILTKKNIKEKSAIIYILTKNFGLKKAIAEGINRPESKLITVIQPGSIGKIFLAGNDLNSPFKLISFLPYKIPINVFKKLPYMYLWSLRFLVLINPFEISDEFWNLIVDLDKRVLKFKKLFPLWFMWKIFQELGTQPNLETCSNCNKSLFKSKNIFVYKSSLFCENCRKEGYEKIEKSEYFAILNFCYKEKIFKKNIKWPEILRKIFKNHLREIAL